MTSLPRLINDLLQYDQSKDDMVGIAMSMGIDINMSQEELNGLFNELKLLQ